MYIFYNTKTPASLVQMQIIIVLLQIKVQNAILQQQRPQISTKDDGTLQSGSNLKHLEHASDN